MAIKIENAVVADASNVTIISHRLCNLELTIIQRRDVKQDDVLSRATSLKRKTSL